MKKSVLLFTCALSSLLLNAQSIEFSDASISPQFQDADVGAITFGDVDNDGDLDFMATGKGGPVRSTLYLNDGGGNYCTAEGSNFENLFSGTVKFVDVDNDNDLDLMMTGSNAQPMRFANLYLNDGNGLFSLVIGTPFEPSVAGDFAFSDIDSDGDKDLVMSGLDAFDNPFTAMYLNNGGGVFSEVFSTPFIDLKFGSVEFIDIDGDNDDDLLLTGATDADILNALLYSNDGNGNFSLVTGTPFEGCESSAVAAGDSDNDNDMDLLITGNGSSGSFTSLYANDGSGSFALVAGTPFAGASIGETEFADFDNDGDLDALIIGAGDQVISHIYENQGANSFVLAEELVPAYLSSAAIGDMNGDNDLDIIIAGTSFESPSRATKTYTNLLSENSGIIPGCTRSDACNFNPSANQPDDSCDYWCYGCTDVDAANFSAEHTIDDDSCIYFPETSCNGDLNLDGTVNAGDLLALLSVFGGLCD